VRRSIRKRTRSVRAPSPESILRGSGSGPINPLLFHNEENIAVEHIEMKEISPNIKDNVQQNQQINHKTLKIPDKNIPSSCSMRLKLENTIQGL
jgi:hypothetical protein